MICDWINTQYISLLQAFLGTLDMVYVVDKVENNPADIDGHPAWAAEWSLNASSGRPMDIVTNTFCAVRVFASTVRLSLTHIRAQGGNVLGNGTWLNVGGNQAVTYGGLTANSQTGGAPYDDPDGGKRHAFFTYSASMDFIANVAP